MKLEKYSDAQTWCSSGLTVSSSLINNDKLIEIRDRAAKLQVKKETNNRRFFFKKEFFFIRKKKNVTNENNKFENENKRMNMKKFSMLSK
jgi:hypothetical protein